ncbi:MAG: leucine-rich repeat domain-containing protein, partial [Oscillospiraceae bacterium]|nr:leucine-rich repeat domain-containing protein [Oscillospiraceae bacterium]
NYLLLTGDGTASYTYDVDGENGEHTLSASIEFPAGIEINEENFPDEIFRTYVSDNFDTDNDGVLTPEEIAAVKKIDFYSADITTVADLTGVEHFTALTVLDCADNKLTSLDVSKNTALTELWCTNNLLTSLDVSRNTALKHLACYSNDLTSLDVSKNTSLLTLNCFGNKLQSLNLRGCTELYALHCEYNNLKSLDVSSNTALIEMWCSLNKLTNLDVSNHTSLTELYCGNNDLWTLNLPANYSGVLNYDEENTVIVTGKTLDLSAYGLNAASFSGGTLDENGILTPGTIPGTVTYTYDVDGESGDKTISRTIQFWVDINEENFPDEIFRNYVDTNFDTTDNDILTVDEIAAVTKIDVFNMGITDLTGVEFFTALTELSCGNNQLASLDLSKNTALETLSCYSNQLTDLDVSGCTALETLSCGSNQLTSLDASKNTALETLYCNNNQLTSLDVSNHTALTTLDCYYNRLTSLDVSGCTALTTLYCHYNRLTSLDVSGCTALTNLYCNSNQLTSLDVSGCTALTNLDCNNNRLTSLDVSNHTALTYLDCNSNDLTSLDVSGCTALENLNCDYNDLTSLDVSGCTALEDLDCNYNDLTSLNVSGCTALTDLDCYDNQLTSLDVSGCTALTDLDCSYNLLTRLDMSNNTVLDSLNCPHNLLTFLDVSKNPALKLLACNSNQLSNLDLTEQTELTYFYCNRNPLLAVNAVTGITSYYNASPLHAFTADTPIIRLADYGINADMMSAFTGCELSTDGNYLLLTGNGTASYTYDVDGVNGTHTISVSITYPSGIEINATNFPDEIFRTYVSDNFDTDNDGFLTVKELAAVTEIDVSSMSIKDLTGIGYFTALTNLNCTYNKLESLDMSKNTALTNLTCTANKLTSLDVSKNTALTKLYCSDNSLTSLDVSNNTALTELYFYFNDLTSLDVSKNTALKILGGEVNQLTSLDVSKNTALTELYCSSNRLTSLDVSNNTALTNLSCSKNQLTSLDVSSCTQLTDLDCKGNALWTLDLPVNYSGTLSYNAERTLFTTGASYDLSAFGPDAANFSGGTLDENGILTPDTLPRTVTYTYPLTNGESLTVHVEFSVFIDEAHFPDDVFRAYVKENFDKNGDDILTVEEAATVTLINVDNMGISDLTGVEYFAFLSNLNCTYNNLTSLNVSNNTELLYLYCSSNRLSDLDVSKNTALIDLYCSDNLLTSLDVSENTKLTYLGCSHNLLTGLDVSQNAPLAHLTCRGNQLTSLDVSENMSLTHLDCSSNQLTSLDLTANTALTSLYASYNKYSIDLIDGTFDLSTLPEGFDIAKVSEWSNATVDGNILTVSDPTKAVTYTYDLGNDSTEIFTLNPTSCTIRDDMVQPIEAQTYTGEAIEPEVEIICGDYTLINGIDYTVSFENNIDVGTASATITCTGMFTGEMIVTFKIIQKPIESVTVDVTAPVAGEMPQYTIADGDGYTGVIIWEPAENLFDYNTIYTVTIILTPDSNHIFDESITAEGFEVTLNEDGTVTLTKEFEATAKAKITALIPPVDMTLTEYFTNDEDIIALLPSTITIDAENGTSTLSIEWTLAGEFDASSNAKNTFAWTANIGELDADGFEISGEITVKNVKYVVINETNFPDETFRNYVSGNFDNGDGVLTSDELATVFVIDVPGMGIKDLTGVEYFTELTFLYCNDNQLEKLDVSSNTALTDLNCAENDLTSLDVSTCTALTYLNCYDNQLTSLDVNNCTALINLNCPQNKLTALDVSNCTALIYLTCSKNQLESLDVSKNTALTYLDCANNQLTELDLNNNTALDNLICDNNQLESLDVSKNTALIFLGCDNNQLESLDVSKNTALTELYCFSNQLKALDVSNNTALIMLGCYNNKLTSLDVSKNTALTELYCYDNQLTSLDTSDCTALISVLCDCNRYDIDLIGGTFDLSALPGGFDVTKASDWSNAAVEGNTLIVSSLTTDVTYVYDLGNDSTEVFTLKPVSCTITEDMVSEIADQFYIGEEIEPIEIICGDYPLIENEDYTVVYENNVNAGTATATITGMGFFAGEISVEFTILPEKIENLGMRFDDILIYNGEEQIKSAAITHGSMQLTEGVDYIIAGNTGTNAGEYTMTITGMGNYTSTHEVTWIIEKAVPEIITPTAGELTYGQKLSESVLSDSAWKWFNPGVIPTVNNSGYVTFIPVEDSRNYDYTGIEGYAIWESVEVIARVIPVTVNKATPTVTPIIPEGEYTEGDPLPELLYRSETDGLIAWMTELKQLIVGENVLEWQFSPEDQNNYKAVTGTAVVEAKATTTTTTTTETTTTTTASTSKATTTASTSKATTTASTSKATTTASTSKATTTASTSKATTTASTSKATTTASTSKATTTASTSKATTTASTSKA